MSDWRQDYADQNLAPGGEPKWREITVDEYRALADSHQPLTVGATNSDPGGSRFGTPHMLTTWESADGRPILRHQCWPVGLHGTGFARPCLYETTLPTPGVESEATP